VELHPGYLTLRQKRRRDRIAVDYQAILEFEYKIRALEAQRERAEQKRLTRANAARGGVPGRGR